MYFHYAVIVHGPGSNDCLFALQLGEKGDLLYMSDEKKMITIIMAIYNKGEYLSEAVESILMQEGEYKYKIIMINDGSTDNSKEIAMNYVEMYPDKIEFMDNEINRGYMYSLRKGFGEIKTPYFTVLDPDDYWISKNKISKSVSFLELHKDFSMYCTNYYLEYMDKKRKSGVESGVSYAIMNDISELIYVQTSAVVFRNFFTQDILGAMDKCIGDNRDFAFEGDTFRDILALHFGKGYFENSCDSVWRQGSGEWSTLHGLEQGILNCCGVYRIFEFLLLLHDTKNAAGCLVLSYQSYKQTLAVLFQLLLSCEADNWKGSNYLKKHLKQHGIKKGLTEDITLEDIMNVILDMSRKYKSYGLPK